MKFHRYVGWSAGLFAIVAVVAWMLLYSTPDLALSAHFYDAHARAFPLQHQPFIDFFGRRLVWFVPFGGAALLALVAWKQPARSQRRLAWAGAALFMGSGPLLAGVFKHLTAMPRPLNLDVFNGTEVMPPYFWTHSLAQAGNALPSAHAASGFALLALFFAGSMLGRKGLAWTGLVLGLCAGLLFGFLRIVQGYHFLSQVVASCAVLGLYGCALFYGLHRWALHRRLTH